MLFRLAAAAAAEARMVDLVGGNITDLAVHPSNATASLELRANGEEWHDKDGTLAKAGDWLVLGSADAYEVRATVQSGDTPSGTIGSWSPMNQLNAWTHEQSGRGSSSCNLLVEVRLAATGGIIESAVYFIEAEVI